MVTFHLLAFEGLPIFQQLQIEEALLRADDRNWCLLNFGSTPAVILGISGKQIQHIHPEKMQQNPIPIIRRFSGGGTVVVDEQTCFYSLIGNRSMLNFPCYPQELLRWTERLYTPAFSGIDFALRDNDYVIGNNKFGGNAQYITKDRWLHHSSLLWNYDFNLMDYLLIPPKMPAYREQRSHASFLCKLCDHFPSKEIFKSKMLSAIQAQFTLIPTAWESMASILERDHRRSTRIEKDCPRSPLE